jgi:arylsulfatase A-like enzyme
MKKRSLVLVTVDCLRADHVGFQGYSRPVTPFLDSLARNKDSVVLTDAIVAGVPTYHSFPAIMASRYPLSLGRDILGIAPNEPTLATALQSAGCATAAFLAGNPYLSTRFGYHAGFDTFHDFLDAPPPEGSPTSGISETSRLSDFNRRAQKASRRSRLTEAAYDELYFWYCQWRSARENLSLDTLRRYPAANLMVDQAASWLQSIRDQRFFLWIHLMDPHYPHYPPPETLSALGLSYLTPRRARFLNSVWNRADVRPERLLRYREEILSLYDAGVFWVDKQMSRLIGTLQELQRWDETVFVLTADHGEEFLEHGARYHSPVGMSELLVHVPLLMRVPAFSGGRIAGNPFSMIHLAPTLMEAVGDEIPESFQGRSYWEQIAAGEDLHAGPAIVEAVGTGANPLRLEERMRPRQMAIRDRDYKLVINFGERTDRLYDLRNDPGEQSPLPADALPGERGRLMQLARAHLEKTRHDRETSDQNAELALRARLRQVQHSTS